MISKKYLTNLSVFRSNMNILGGHTTEKVTRLSRTPESITQSLLHLSILTLKTETNPEQLLEFAILPEAASACHSQLGYA